MDRGPSLVCCESGGIVVCFEEKTYVEKLEIFDGNGYCHQFQHVNVKVFSDWLQDPQLFSDRLLLRHNQLIAHPSASLN